MANSPNIWFSAHKPKPRARLRLFCLPYAGGGASIYRSWITELPDSVEVCPIQLPGRENRLSEAPYTRMAALIDALVPVLRPYLDKPFAFFGYSMGSAISYELTLRLRADLGLDPEHLLVAARRAPQLPDHDEPRYDLPDEEFKAKLRAFNGTPEEVLNHPELMELLLPLVRKDFELNDTYQASSQPLLSCPVTVFGGNDDPNVQRHHLEAWRTVTSGPFQLHLLPGDHFFIHQHGSLMVSAVIAALAP